MAGIKVVQVNSGDLMGRRFNGYDLKPHLEKLGVDSKQIVYWNKQSDADFVSKVFDYPYSRHITRALNIVESRLSLHARLHPHSWTLPLHQKVREADLLHLHIIHDGYFSMSALPYVTRRKPTVWTWHDPWTMTGHCVHPFDCERWMTGCGSCPNLETIFPMRTDRTAQQYAWKQRIYRQTKAEIIVASQWMLDMAKRSPLAEAFNFHVIPFGLDLARYQPRNRADARRRFGVIGDRPVLLIRASSTPFKGLPEFVRALDHLPQDLSLCIIAMQESGHFDHFIGRHQIIEFPWTNDEDLLLDAYAACDVFMMPSMAESFGLMAIEAMACGRPVLAFDGTALAETIHAPDAGVTVPKGNVVELAKAIAHLARSPEECARRGERSRWHAERCYDIRRQAELTAALYQNILSPSASPARTPAQ